MQVALALSHKYGIITTLPFRKHASPIFTQRKPNGKLRLLVDSRKVSNLISGDYNNNNQLVGTLADAAKHMAEKHCFCILDCLEVYHWLQLAHQRSVEMPANNFVNRKFAYRKLAQGLTRFLSAISCFFLRKS